MRLAIGRDQAVAAEVVIAGDVLRAEVAAVGPEGFFAGLHGNEVIAGRARLGLAQSLVHPVPDEPALQVRQLINFIPVGREIAGAVAHGVLVFTHDVRACLRPGGVVGEARRIRIHRRNQVHIIPVPRAFVMHRPAVVPLMNPFRRRLKIRAAAGLVAQRPDDDGGMIFVALDHAPDAVQVRVGEILAPGERLIVKTHAVAFDVRLIHQINPVTVTQVIPCGLVRIMTAPVGVHVELFHALDVALHAFHRDGLAAIRIKLMAVDALDEEAPAVDEQIAIANLDLAETDIDRNDFERFARAVLEREQQPVEVGMFRRPLERVGNYCRERDRLFLHRADIKFLHRETGHGFALGVKQLRLNRRRAVRAARVVQLQFHAQFRVAILRVECRLNLKIADVNFRRRPQVHVAENAAQAPHVLVFEI